MTAEPEQTASSGTQIGRARASVWFRRAGIRKLLRFLNLELDTRVRNVRGDDGRVELRAIVP